MKVSICKQEGVENEIIIKCQEIDEEITEVLKWLESKNKRIIVHDEGTVKKLDPKDILYCEAVDRKVFIYTIDAVETTYHTLSELEAQFSSLGFVRCSKSMVVNIKHIQFLKSELSGRIIATLTNDERIIISRHYARLLRKQLME